MANDEPMIGLSKLILGCAYCVQKRFDEAVENFRKCLDMRKNLPANAEDAHVSAFCQYELAALLLRSEEVEGLRPGQNSAMLINFYLVLDQRGG